MQTSHIPSHSIKNLCVFVCLIFSFLFISLSCLEAATLTWDGEGSTTEWSDCSNWSSNTCPGASDIATFDSTSTKNSTLDGNFGGSVAGVNIGSGYTGTITQAHFLIVGSSNYVQSGGTFTGVTNYNITINGDFTVTGGTFGATPSTMTVSGNFTQTAGTFNAQTGKVVLNGTSSVTVDVNTTETFYELEINKTSSTDADDNVTLTGTDSLIVTSKLTLTDGQVYGGDSTAALDAQGDVTVGSSYSGGTSALNFSGGNSQSFDLTGGTNRFDSTVTINKTAGSTVTLASDLILDNTGQDLTLSQGTLNISTKNLTVLDDFTFTGGAFTNGGSNSISIGDFAMTGSSSISFSGQNSSMTLTSSFTLANANATFTSTSGTLTLTGDFTNSSGTFTHNSGTVTLDGTNQTLSGATTFYNLTKTPSTAATLTLPASTTVTIAGTTTLKGASGGALLSLRSSTSGTQTKINPQGTRSLQYLDVKDNNNTNSTVMSCTTGCTDNGNNTNWEFGPTVQFASTSSSGSESSTSVSLSVSLSSSSSSDVTVNYAVGSGTATSGGTDFTLSDGTLTITAGSVSGSISITVVNDTLDENDETIIVTLSSSTNATLGTNTTHTYTITDNDDPPSVSFTSSSQSGAESVGTMTVTAQLSTASGLAVSVPYTITGTATGSGTDYTITSSPVSISAGSTTATVTITVVSDALDEANETVILTMGSPTNASQGSTTTHTATITDDDSSTITYTCDNTCSIYVDGTLIVTDTNWRTADSYSMDLTIGTGSDDGSLIAAKVDDTSWVGGFACRIDAGGSRTQGSDFVWKVLAIDDNNPPSNWNQTSYSDSSWSGATEKAIVGQGRWGSMSSFSNSDSKAKWIWSSKWYKNDHVLFRARVNPSTNGLIIVGADNRCEVYQNGTRMGAGTDWSQPIFIPAVIQTGDVIAVHATDEGGIASLISEITWEENGTRRTVVSDGTWRLSTENVSGWESSSYTDTSWGTAHVTSSLGSGPWGTTGTLEELSRDAKWIWDSNTEGTNEVWVRKSISASPNATLTYSCDNSAEVYVNGVLMSSLSEWGTPQSTSLNLSNGDVIAVKGMDAGGIAGFIGSISYNGSTLLTNSTWKVSKGTYSDLSWAQKTYDDSGWGYAVDHGGNGISPWGNLTAISSDAHWIWTGDNNSDDTVYFRFTIGNSNTPVGQTTLYASADNSFKLYKNGVLIASGSEWSQPQSVITPLSSGDILAIEADDLGYKAGMLFYSTGTYSMVSDTSWKMSTVEQANWNTSTFDDSSWEGATDYGAYGVSPWENHISGWPSTSSHWIWSRNNVTGSSSIDSKVFFRKRVL
ncbi:MAG: hypothetical protein HYS08_02790 [Chlamydiae bacterium]|nr:hypothetical protein [Chlamydiota bacterium]MBI3267235.1 hypothetical protein [Chlamydiota bacterium]